LRLEVPDVAVAGRCSRTASHRVGRAGEFSVLRASVHRLAAYGVTGASMEGWTAVPEDALAALALIFRTPGCLIRWDKSPRSAEPDIAPSVAV
jgi:hypothetical protein